jgi:hypothetical protein
MDKTFDEEGKKHIDLPKGKEENSSSPNQRNLCTTSVDVFIWFASKIQIRNEEGRSEKGFDSKLTPSSILIDPISLSQVRANQKQGTQRCAYGH